MTLVVSVPDRETLEQIGSTPDGIRLVVWDLYGPPSAGTVDDINVVLLPAYQMDQSPFDQFKTMANLRAVQLPSAGFEHVARFIPDSVALLNGRGVHTEETAEMAVGLLIASRRAIGLAAQNQVQSRSWQNVMRPAVYRSKVLIIGYGSIGKAVADRLVPFGVELLIANRTAKQDGDRTIHSMDALPELLPLADSVVIIVPLTSETRHLVNAEFLAQMKDGASLVNVARGKIVDTEALFAEVQSGRLLAALDVTDPEPLPPEHPLWVQPGVIITQHEGGDTTVSQAKTVELMQSQLTRFAAGEEFENIVKPAV